ncbi:hypothetical protein ABIE61_001092 [Marinobacterium sp. MBR-111]|jgi:hypothetical protein|uniref:EH signature domain-containing protein n=1 Tax=Marinobacterium sp. MBR-111 TaxID=3156463 RepID=UPI003398508D
MSVKELLDTFDPAIRFSIHLPSKSRLKQASIKLEKELDVQSTDVSIPDHLIKETASLVSAGQASRIPQRNLRLFCVAGLSSFCDIGAAKEAVQNLLGEVEKRAKRSLLRALLNGYLQIADLDYSWTGAIRRFLRRHSNELPARWRQRCDDYGLLDEIPCQTLIDSFQALDVDFDRQLHEAGVTGSLYTNGIGTCVLSAICDDLTQREWLTEANAEELLTRFLFYLAPQDKLLFLGSTNQVKIVSAMLTPCLNGGVSQHLVRRIQYFLLTAYSDPRVNPGKWGQVPTELVELLKRWLTKQAMGLLIEVLNKTADDHHWDSRHDFWNYYLDNDLVDEAWVAFGPNAFQQARDLIRFDNDFVAGTFAQLVKGAGQIQANHSVLLMRIDSVVIAEWTHNGMVRLWDRVGTGSPPFYRSVYKSELLRGSAGNPPQDEHRHDAHGAWKGKVAAFIQARTGIKHGVVKTPTSPGPKKPFVSTSRPSSTPYRPALSNTSGRSDNTEAISGGPTTGTCKGCGKTKPASEFYLSRKRPGQLTVFCKQCSAKK